MNVRWLWLDFIPSWLKLSPEERHVVRRKARQKADLSAPRAMGQFAIAIVLAVPWCLVSFWLKDVALQLGLPAITFLPVTLAGLWIIGILAFGPIVAHAAYEELRERGHDICVHCGYWLRHTKRDAEECPECGSSLKGRKLI
jgi:hypothetical protein